MGRSRFLATSRLLVCVCITIGQKSDELWFNRVCMRVSSDEIFEPNYEHDSVVLLDIHR